MQTQFTDEQKEFINTMVIADAVYDGVIERLNIDQNDPIYRELVDGMLRRQTIDFLIFKIWRNMDEEQLRNFRKYLSEAVVTEPWASADEILIEFALMHPKLLEKIYSRLPEFFDRFIERFNGIMES